MGNSFFARVRKLSTIRGVNETDLINLHGIKLAKLIEPDVKTLKKLKEVLNCPYQMLIDGTLDGMSFDDYLQSFESDIALLRLQVIFLKKTG